MSKPEFISIPINPLSAEKAPTRILVVDDVDSNRDVLSRRLERAGYVTVPAADGFEALKLIDSEPFDLVVLDVMMPRMSGLEVLQTIRKTRSGAELPVIMATARDQSSDVVEALNLGANDYVTKPIDFSVALARVRTQLSLRESIGHIIDLEKRLSQRNEELEKANERLLESAKRTQRELDLAAKVQNALLPESAPQVAGFSFSWVFLPCHALAGDALNINQLGPDHIGFYVLDVSGHGVAAALLSVTAMRSLSSTGRGSMVLRSATKEPVPPAEVLQRMDAQFPFNSNTEQFLTLFYAVVNTATREMTYASAGHPGAIRITREGASSILDHSNLPIGLGGQFEQRTVQLDPGDRVFLYTDGVIEERNADGEEFGKERLIARLTQAPSETLDCTIAAALETLNTWRAAEPSRDDVSILAFACE